LVVFGAHPPALRICICGFHEAGVFALGAAFVGRGCFAGSALELLPVSCLARQKFQTFRRAQVLEKRQSL